MRKPQGYLVQVEPGAPTIERDTLSCCHCNSVVVVVPGADPSTMGGFCQMCMKNTCPRCHAKGGCTPFEKKLEAFERRSRLLQHVTGGA